jgi:hypothetical protein
MKKVGAGTAGQSEVRMPQEETLEVPRPQRVWAASFMTLSLTWPASQPQETSKHPRYGPLHGRATCRATKKDPQDCKRSHRTLVQILTLLPACCSLGKSLPLFAP